MIEGEVLAGIAITNAVLQPRDRRVSTHLQYMLVLLLEGSAQRLLEPANDGEGLLSWRRVRTATARRETALLLEVLAQTFKGRCAEITGPLRDQGSAIRAHMRRSSVRPREDRSCPETRWRTKTSGAICLRTLHAVHPTPSFARKVGPSSWLVTPCQAQWMSVPLRKERARAKQGERQDGQRTRCRSVMLLLSSQKLQEARLLDHGEGEDPKRDSP